MPIETLAFLSLVVFAFALFMSVLAYTSWATNKR